MSDILRTFVAYNKQGFDEDLLTMTFERLANYY